MKKYLPSNIPKNLNIGCGWDLREGFLNVDFDVRHEPDVIADACDMSMLPSGYFDYILAQDVLEHLEREKTCVALCEWARLLAPDGVMTIRVPSLLGMFELLARPQSRSWEEAEKLVVLMYGNQVVTGDYHLAGFTAELLVEYLRRAGLVVSKAALKDEWLFDVDVVNMSALSKPEDLVHNAYFEVLGRPADAGGLALFSERLSSGEMSAANLRNLLRSSDEHRIIHSKPIYLKDHPITW